MKCAPTQCPQILQRNRDGHSHPEMRTFALGLAAVASLAGADAGPSPCLDWFPSMNVRLRPPACLAGGKFC